jgi:CheY-like chemotaxis protein
VKVAAPALPPRAEIVERRVVLLGFSDFERHQLETVLRLAGARAVRYRLVTDAAQAELAVADADDAEAQATVRRLGLVALSVGSGLGGGGTPHLARPINVAQVVRALDPLARRGPPPSPPVQRVLDELAHVAGLPPPRPRARLLVAAHEAVATPLLLAPLQRAGCELLRVRSGAEAIERARDSAPDLVLIDAGLDGLDGYHACRSIKQRAQAEGRVAPTVVMIAAGPMAVNRVRADMAGADQLLPAPLDAEAVLALLPGPEPGTRPGG